MIIKFKIWKTSFSGAGSFLIKTLPILESLDFYFKKPKASLSFFNRQPSKYNTPHKGDFTVVSGVEKYRTNPLYLGLLYIPHSFSFRQTHLASSCYSLIQSINSLSVSTFFSLPNQNVSTISFSTHETCLVSP